VFSVFRNIVLSLVSLEAPPVTSTAIAAKITLKTPRRFDFSWTYIFTTGADGTNYS
jgi:hypothetical protein